MNWWKFESYEEQLQNLSWLDKREHIINRDNHRCKMCGRHLPSLNVHHRYYLFEHKAWEYNDEVLVTLCKKCHEFIHIKHCPIVYYQKGDLLIPLNFTPCSRCGGRGYIPEYRHISDGICFRCNGEKYDELIYSFKGSVDNYYKTNDDCFDVIKNDYSEEKLEIIFQNAKAYQKGTNGHSINESEAVKLYTIAAKHGYCKAQNNLGLYYYKKGDKERGFRWLTYAAIQGHSKSVRNLRILK